MRVKKHAHAGLAGPRREFVKLTQALSDGSRGGGLRRTFDDFLELAYCALAKQTHAPDSARGEALEARYGRIATDRPADYMASMAELLALAAEGVCLDCDFLGEVAGDLGSLSEHLGQFFTPFHLSRVMAGMVMGNVGELIAERGYVTICDPCSGAGGMILAAASHVAAQGHDPSRVMLATTCDVSLTAYQMTYIQLALRGIPAHCYHGNSLSLETWEAESTPAVVTFSLAHSPAARSVTRLLALLAGDFDALVPAEAGPVNVAPQVPMPEAVRAAAMQVDARGQGLLFAFDEATLPAAEVA